MDHKNAHASTDNVNVQGGSTLRLPSLALSIGGNTVQERGRNCGRLLSGLITINILILGCALVSGSVFNKVEVTTIHLQIFLIVLVILTTIWIIYYIVYTFREEHAILYKDSHAGPIWLRGGLVLFGLCSLIMDVLKIAYYVGFIHCDSPVKIVFPCVQIVFLFVQTYFLWLHAKDCVQLQRNLTRCGLMLTLSTNLVLWMTAVTEESLHQMVFPSTNTSRTYRNMAKRASPGDQCQCSNSACGIFQKAYYYLYPFNIEYSLFASAMAYVMWKNVGRMLDEHHHYPHPRFHMRDALVGPVAGLVMLVAGLATFVVYEIDVAQQDKEARDTALMMHYIMNIVVITSMSVVTVVGSTVYRLDQRGHVSGKNPTRTLDIGLLLGASIGQFTICYFTIVATFASGVRGHLNALALVCSMVTAVQLGLQNIFIIEGLHREPFTETQPLSAFANGLALSAQGGSSQESLQRATVTTSSPALTASTPPGLSWQRRLLKEICAFLLLCNIILWIMPAFGARPQFDNPVGTEIYTFSMWVAVVNI